MNKEKFFRFLELVALLAFIAYLGLILWGIATTLLHGSYGAWFYMVLLIIPILGYCAADIVSGFVHFLADNFGTEKMFFFGPKFIMPFREHHTDPKKITEHSFVQVSGNISIVGLVAAVPAYHLINPAGSPLLLSLSMFILFFLLAIFLTNKIHAWAHADYAPPFVRWLQRKRLILSPEHHNVHHTSPHDTYYCITTGWFNATFEKLGFFKKIVAWIQRFQEKSK